MLTALLEGVYSSDISTTTRIARRLFLAAQGKIPSLSLSTEGETGVTRGDRGLPRQTPRGRAARLSPAREDHQAGRNSRQPIPNPRLQREPLDGRERTVARGSPCRPAPPHAARSRSGARSPRSCGSRRQESRTRPARPGARARYREARAQAGASSEDRGRNRPERRELEPVSLQAEAGASRTPTRHPTELRIARPALLPARSSRPSAALLPAHRSRRTKALHPTGYSAACSRTKGGRRRDPEAAARPASGLP